MTAYRSMYLLLFNAVTDALLCLAAGDAAKASRLLIRAQQKCEDIYIETGE